MLRLSKEYSPEELARIIDICMKALRSKDAYTFAHSERVGKFAEQIATAMDLDDEDLSVCRVLGRLHDIGKLFVPSSILKKPASLSEQEWEVMRKHSEDNVRILSCMSFVEKHMEVVESLHERFDGTGYPNHLEGCQIPVLARILAVADSYDAMTSDRPYRKAQSLEYVYGELLDGRGKQFCPEVVDKALNLLERQMKKPYVVVTAQIKKLVENAVPTPLPSLAFVKRAA
ncbi:MAG: HD-GYP domain-containing protein [Candidatus Omnitrophica bacterium]|nr:HD-GYP domain-containing protein [Candidatus Omnitrophota bacterium]